jgi:cyanate lyase
MDRSACTETVLRAKAAKGLTFAQIAEKVGRHEVWTTAALLEAQMDAAEAAAGVEDPKGDRVRVVHDGKFLPYRKW